MVMTNKLAILLVALIQLAPGVWSMNFTDCGELCCDTGLCSTPRQCSNALSFLHSNSVVYLLTDVSVSGSQIGSLVNVAIRNCDAHVCTLYSGTVAYVIIQFTANRVIESGQTAYSAKLVGYPFRMRVRNDTLCAYTQPSCPIQADGTVYTYTYRGYVSSVFPRRHSMEMRWTLSSNEETLACAEFPINVVNLFVDP
ncbi:unnamed protein product [Dicrocoelium dendriticum]|nr:unnamed protein product [Dicrocoelium dendriticum]